jgi:hypothetical protein
MPMRASAIGKLLVWVLALLAPLQPILALDCSCCCKVASSAIKQGTCQRAEGHCKEHASCDHRHTERPLSETAVENDRGTASSLGADPPLPGCRPCNCPQDCNCHVRHATRIGILTTHVARIGKDACGVPLGQITLGLLLPLYEQRANARPHHFSRETSALAVCALLCRFAS